MNEYVYIYIFYVREKDRNVRIRFWKILVYNLHCDIVSHSGAGCSGADVKAKQHLWAGRIEMLGKSAIETKTIYPFRLWRTTWSSNYPLQQKSESVFPESIHGFSLFQNGSTQQSRTPVSLCRKRCRRCEFVWRIPSSPVFSRRMVMVAQPHLNYCRWLERIKVAWSTGLWLQVLLRK